jgi:hypothetical protein
MAQKRSEKRRYPAVHSVFILFVHSEKVPATHQDWLPSQAENFTPIQSHLTGLSSHKSSDFEAIIVPSIGGRLDHARPLEPASETFGTVWTRRQTLFSCLNEFGRFRQL